MIGGSKPMPVSGATDPAPFTDGGAYPTTDSFNGGQIVIAPPASGSASLFSATPQEIYDSFVSVSPAAGVAANAGFGTPSIFQASYTDLTFGPLNPTTHVVTPTFNDTPVWILIYTNVHWPTGGGTPNSNHSRELMRSPVAH
jgi:hypothetical protein